MLPRSELRDLVVTRRCTVRLAKPPDHHAGKSATGHSRTDGVRKVNERARPVKGEPVVKSYAAKGGRRTHDMSSLSYRASGRGGKLCSPTNQTRTPQRL